MSKFSHLGPQILLTDSYKIGHKQTYSLHHEWRREFESWGSYGKDGKGPLKRILIKDLEDEHLLNIIKHLHDFNHTLETHPSLPLIYDEISWRMGEHFWQKI